jgi:uncharacterized protein involved in exopolysaccharide biosynthesis
MANDNSANGASPVVTLFQKAHGRMVMLQRVDEQLAGLLDQRRKIQDELRSVQTQINEEFDRVMKQADAAPARLLSQIAEQMDSTSRFNTRLDVEEEEEVVG